MDEQTANLVWPDDRAWCLATEIDSEVTYVGGSEELIAAVLGSEELETRAVSPKARLLGFHNVLQPVVEEPAGGVPGPGFHLREGRPWPSPDEAAQMRTWVEQQELAWARECQQPRLVRALRWWWRRVRGRQGRGYGTVYMAREDD